MKIPKWVKVLGIALGSLSIASVIGMWLFFHYAFASPMKRCKGHDKFSVAVWHDAAATNGPLAVRGCVIDDFLATRPLKGAKRASVVGWLGEPPPTSYFRDYDMVYWLGPERSPSALTRSGSSYAWTA